MTGGSWTADTSAIGFLTGGALSGYEQHGMSGALHGANVGLNSWSQAVTAGQYGFVPRELSAGVNDAVEAINPFGVAASVSHAVSHVASRASGDVTQWGHDAVSWL